MSHISINTFVIVTIDYNILFEINASTCMKNIKNN